MRSKCLNSFENDKRRINQSNFTCFDLDESRAITIYGSEICKIMRYYSNKEKKYFCIKTYNPNYNLIALRELYLNQLIKNYLTKKRKNSIVNYISFFSLKSQKEIKHKTMNNKNKIESEANNKISLSHDFNMVFEYSRYGNLIDFINNNNNYFNSSTNLRFFIQDIVLGLSDLHNIGIVHNDLKLDNILMFKHKGRIVAKICDFNNSFLLNDPNDNANMEYSLTKFGFYEKPDYRTDYFELGIVLFQILFFENPLKYLKKIKKNYGEVNYQDKLYQINNDTEDKQSNPFKIDIQKQKLINLQFDNEKVNENFYINLNENLEFRLFSNNELKDLITNLIQINPNKRLDDKNIFKHEFFKEKKRRSKLLLLKNLRTNRLVRRLTNS